MEKGSIFGLHNIDNKIRHLGIYRLVRNNESKLPEIRQEEKPTASREIVEQRTKDRNIAILRLGGDDGTQVTLAQIKKYLEATLRFIEVSGESDKVLQIAQYAQNLTTADGKRAALAFLQTDFNYFNQDTILVVKPGLPNDHLLYAAVAKERQRRVIALRTSMDFLLPTKASS